MDYDYLELKSKFYMKEGICYSYYRRRKDIDLLEVRPHQGQRLCPRVLRGQVLVGDFLSKVYSTCNIRWSESCADRMMTLLYSSDFLRLVEKIMRINSPSRKRSAKRVAN